MPKRGENISLSSYDDIFGTDESRADSQLERIQKLSISELVPFKGHPFRVVDDEAMLRTTESIAQFGVLTPLIVRPMEGGKYEIISGHRRVHAAELAGLSDVPAIVREMDDDAAVVLMVDSNLQRESILPSEREPMMTFDEFLKTVLENLQNRFSDMDVRRQEVNKLQNESYVGIGIQPKGSNVAVTFRLQEMFNEYLKNEQLLPGILARIAHDAEQALSGMPSFDTNIIEKYENVKDHLVMQMVPIKGNEDMLQTIPHRTVDDMAVVYRVEMAYNQEGAATALLTNQILASFGISEEQLHNDAVKSQAALHPPVLKNMADVMKEMTGGLFDDNESPMWVATNDGGIQGASVVEIPDFMNQSAEKLGGDFFVIPSSVHDILIISAGNRYTCCQVERPGNTTYRRWSKREYDA